MKSIFEFLLFAGVLLVAAGSYGGNALIGAGHGFLLLAIGTSFFVKTPERKGAKLGFRLPLSAWILVAFVGFCGLSVFFNWESYDKPFNDLKKLRHLLLPVVILGLPVIKAQVLERRSFYGKWAFTILLGVAVLVTVADMINMATGFHFLVPGGLPRTIRLGGIFGMVMTYAYSMQFTIFVLTGFLLIVWRKGWEVPRWLFRLGLASLIVTTVGLFLSGSRGALLGCVAGGIVLMVVLRSWWFLGASAGLAMISVLASMMIDNQLLVVRPNESTRVAQWKTAIVTGLRHPLTGIGYRQFEKQSRDLKEKYQFPHDVRLANPDGTSYSYHMKGHAHNIYFEALASTGVFGMISLVLFFGAWLRETLSKVQTRFIFVPALAGFMVAGFFENSFFDSEITSMLMLFYVASQVMMTDK